MFPHLDRAGADWDRQRRLDDDHRRAQDALRREQAERVREEHVATRKRVLWEMGGLVLVAVGTVIASWA
jgi:hypothetical protein